MVVTSFNNSLKNHRVFTQDCSAQQHGAGGELDILLVVACTGTVDDHSDVDRATDPPLNNFLHVAEFREGSFKLNR